MQTGKGKKEKTESGKVDKLHSQLRLVSLFEYCTGDHIKGKRAVSDDVMRSKLSCKVNIPDGDE